MSLKCISTRDLNRGHCDMPADYVYVGKSYCYRHMKFAVEEFTKQV